jgi:hypothetical protein
VLPRIGERVAVHSFSDNLVSAGGARLRIAH